MKRIIITCFTVLLSSLVFAQANSSDKDLLVKYTEKELESIKNNDPKEYNYLKYCVKNAFYIATTSKDKVKTSPKDYKEISLKDLDVKNFYDLKIDVLEDNHQTFLVKGTEKVLIVKSKTHILREFKNK